MAESPAARPDWVQCIEQAHGMSWCGNRITSFHFTDLDHAAQTGLVGGRLVACTQCVDAALKALRAGTSEAGAAPVGWTWTYMGMRHFTGHRDVAEQIAATATELGAPVEVRPVCVAGAAIGEGDGNG
jgi:hypothetical protein